MTAVAREPRLVPEIAAADQGPVADIAEMSVVTDVAMLEEEWRAFGATAVGHVFQTYDFMAAWLAHVGATRGVSPRIVIGRDKDGAMLFLLPFGIRRCFKTRVLEWLGGEHADFHCGLYALRFLVALSIDPKRAAALPRSVVELFAAEADAIHFQRQPATLEGGPNPFATFEPIPYSAKSYLTRLTGTWDAYYRSKRNSNSRRHDRSKWRRMEAAGPVRFIDAAGPGETGKILGALFAQKDKRLLTRGVPSFFGDESVRSFYEAMALRPYPEGPTHVTALECDGKVVATNWGLVRGNHYYYVMTSYDSGPIAVSSPGRALMHHLMRWCIERGIDVFDFTIGDEDFKTQWCEELAPLFDSVAALSPRGYGLAATLRATKSLKRAIKGNPRLRSLVEQVRGALFPARAPQ